MITENLKEQALKKECQKIYQKNYYLKNKQKASEYRKQYYTEHINELKQKARKKYLKNRQHLLDCSKKYYTEHKKSISSYKKRWYEARIKKHKDNIEKTLKESL